MLKDLAIYLPYIEMGVVLFSILLTVWVIFDSLKRYRNKWIIPVITLSVSFLPFFISTLINKSNIYFLLSSIFIWIVYLVIRPEYSVEETKLIENENRIRELTKKYYEYELRKSGTICPVCGLPIEKDFVICPNCFTRLQNKCQSCGKLVNVSWTVCPYCENKLIIKDVKHEN